MKSDSGSRHPVSPDQPHANIEILKTDMPHQYKDQLAHWRPNFDNGGS